MQSTVTREGKGTNINREDTLENKGINLNRVQYPERINVLIYTK